MSDDLSIQGELSETTVPDLFRSLVRSGETAVVTLQAEGRADTIYFREGKIIYASSTDPDMALGEVLLRSGELNLHQYDQAMERLVTSRRMGALLCELGYLQPDELLRAVERQSSAIVLNAMAYRGGNYTIEFTDTLPEEIVALPLATERLILDGVQRVDHWSLIFRGISRLDRIVEQVPGADSRSYHLELSEEESHVLALLSETQTVEVLCSRSYLPNFATCRTLWGLLAVNLVRDAEALAVDERRAAEATEYELEGLIEKYNTVFENVFTVVFQKVGDHVYDFVDRVVVHLSPETLPYLSGMNLVNEARIDVDQLLNNVIASGSSDHAAIVRRVLDELLYGWMYEVKNEFGSEMEAEVVRAAESLKR
ncbi:MAG: DUF4388 domain-containing protein [Acidobacteriota bacterium]